MKFRSNYIILILICVSFLSLFADGNKPTSEPLLAFKKDSIWHFIDHDGKQLFSPKKLKKIGGFREGFFVVVFEMNKKDNWGFMNLKGDVFKPNDADEVRLFRDGMAMTIKVIDSLSGESLFGFVNSEGEQVVPNKYLDATDFNEGLGWVMNRTERGYLNRKGKFVALFEGRKFGNPFFEGMASFHDESELFGFIDTSFKPAIAPQYDELGNFSEGLASFSENAKYGFLDKRGNKIIPPKYDAVTEFKEGIAFVGQADTNQNFLWGIINKSGNVIVDWQYEQVREYSEGLIAVKKNNKWFFIDQLGNKIINKEFDYADSFKNGLAWVHDLKEKKKGFIDPLGNWILEVDDGEVFVDLRWNRVLK